MHYDWGWKPYVSTAERRLQALRASDKLRKKGHPLAPVKVEGRTIANTFWGRGWCQNLERYSDFANRLPRGRTYVRNGSVIDLQIAPGSVKALVSGSRIYEIVVKITPVTKARWRSICKDCAGAIDSLVELLQGRFSTGVMERICREKTGLFPSPNEIQFGCSCPDWASMCKHVAAVLYGIGARLDNQPELLFRLHQLDEKELISHVSAAVPMAKKRGVSEKILRSANLSDLFGLDMVQNNALQAKLPSKTAIKSKRVKKTPGPTHAGAGTQRRGLTGVAGKKPAAESI